MNFADAYEKYETHDPIYKMFDADFSATPVQSQQKQNQQNMWTYLYYKFF